MSPYDEDEDRVIELECRTREEMLKKIQELDFAIVDISLYLDTHPDDKRAISLHNEYVRDMKDIRQKFQEKYGALSINFPEDDWNNWIEKGWPWERGNN